MDMATIKDAITIILFGISVYGFMSARAKDGELRTTEFVKVNMKLDSLCQGNAAIKESLRDLENSTHKMETRLTVLEEKLIVANHRIDDLERGNQNE